MSPPKDPIKRAEWSRKKSEAQTGEKNHFYGKPRSKKLREMQSQKMRGRKSSFLGKHHTKEALRRQSEIKRGKNHPMFGKHHSEKTRRKMSDAQRGEKATWYGKFGELSPTWKGGISFEPYPITFNEAFKRFVRGYYGNVCINCGKTPEENDRKLAVHHYDYDKNSKNCVPTCNSCNSIANGSKDDGSRAFWEDWYTEILNEFYPKN